MTTTLTQPSCVLDIRTIAPRERHPLILGRCDGLAIGESLQIVNDHNPQPLRLQLEDRARGQFEWATLQASATFWRIQITRAAQATSPAAATKGDSCCSGGSCCG